MTHTYPNQIPSERALLGGAITDPEKLPALAGEVKAEDFHRPEHGQLWRLLMLMLREKEPIDLVSVPERIAAGKAQEQYGGISYVLSLADQIPSTANLAYYAGIVRKSAIMRRLLEGAISLADAAAASSDASGSIVRELLATSMELAGTKKRVERIGDVGLRALQEMQDEQDGLIEPAMPTPWPQLCGLIGGLALGDLTILAARPSSGKSAVMAAMAMHSARLGHAVGIISLEMKSADIAKRMLSSRARVSLSNIRSPKTLEGRHWDAILLAQEELEAMPMSLTDEAGLSAPQIVGHLQKWAAEGVELVFIDHLGEMGLDAAERQDLRVGNACKMIRNAAKDLGIHIVMLCQLSRGVEKRPGCIPALPDLRDAGTIEELADNVIFVYREHHHYPDKGDPYRMDLLVRKARNGVLGDAVLDWDGAIQTITDKSDILAEARSAK